MKKDKKTLPSITKKDRNTPMSKRQKEFNRRIKKVNKLKDELVEMEGMIPEIRSAYQAQIVPLQDKIAEVRVGFVKILDKAYALKYFRVREKEKIQDILLDHAHELIHSYGKSELIPIYDKHNVDTFEEEKEEMKGMTKDMAEEMFKGMFGLDVDLDDVDMDNFEDIGERFKESMKAKEEEAKQRRGKRKKTKAQQAKEERLAKETKDISKSARELYMKLVKEFHPDKEKDAGRQAEMTQKMQRITEAYKNKDLYQLLRLEMELLQGVEDRLDELGEEKLKLYNKLLKDQQDELEGKLNALRYMPAVEPFANFIRFGRHGLKMIDREREALKEKLSFMKKDVVELSDKKQLRVFLRDYEIPKDEEMDFFFLPPDDFRF